MEKNNELSIISSRGENFQSYYFIFYSKVFFYFSLTTLHPFSTLHKLVLVIWSVAAQQNHLSNPSTRAADLFVLLHGMLFTNIQLDNFPGTLARFFKMEGEGVEECEWVMTGVGAVLEYGSLVCCRMGWRFWWSKGRYECWQWQVHHYCAG
jgi:hypothetical protein